jgi:hypothetical protein
MNRHAFSPQEPAEEPERTNTVSASSPVSIKMDWANARGIPDEVITVKRMARHIPDWSADDIAAVVEQLTIFTETPLACKGAECPFAKRCPLVQFGTVPRWAIDGRPCPVEIVEAFRHFAGFVRALDVSPLEYATIQILNDLVRMLVQQRRCDQLIQNEDPVEVMVLGIDPKKGTPIESRKPNELFVVQDKLRTAINTAYKNLVASRDAKLKERTALKGETDAASMMTSLYDFVKRNRADPPAEGAADLQEG